MQDIIGTYGGRLLVAVAAVGIALVLLVLVLRFIRNRAPSPFLRGGRNRQPRLQVLDAAAVDTRRRLVLVRRDDVEHLIMIGGPTDIVIESRIRPNQSAAVEGDEVYDQRSYYAADDDEFVEEDISEEHEDDEIDERPAAPAIARPAPAATPAVSRRDVVTTSNPAAEWRNRADAVTQPLNESRQTSLDLGRQPAASAATEQITRATPTALEAARAKLFPADREQKPVPTTVATPPQRQVGNAAGDQQRQKPTAASITEGINDFEKLLEAEMASRLEANRVPQPRGANAVEATLPRQVTVAQPGQRTAQSTQAAGSDQRAMQQEMARIFGETSPKK